MHDTLSQRAFYTVPEKSPAGLRPGCPPWYQLSKAPFSGFPTSVFPVPLPLALASWNHLPNKLPAPE